MTDFSIWEKQLKKKRMVWVEYNKQDYCKAEQTGDKLSEAYEIIKHHFN